MKDVNSSETNDEERWCTALVHGSGIERMGVFETADHAVSSLRRTDFGRAQSSMRLRTAQPMATSVC